MRYLFSIIMGVLVSLFIQPVYAQQDAVEKGREIYFSYGCALCHGKDGRGNGINAKNYDPPPANFYDLKEYRHGHSKDDIIYSIKHGLKDSESSIMPAFGHLSDAELEQLSSFLLSLQVRENKDIIVSHAWVEIVPPVQKITAAYMSIANNSKAEIVLDSVSTTAAAATEIHQMSQDHGVMKMIMLKNLVIPASSKVELKPGGNHLMLINLIRPVHQGDVVPLTLHFHDGSVLVVYAPAQAPQEEPSSSMPGMKM